MGLRYLYIVVLLLVVMGCAKKPVDVSYRDFRYATQYIIDKQDSLISNYGMSDSITSSDSTFLTMNVWIELSKRYAPGNILVRQLILQNLYLDKDNADEVLYYLNVLSDSGQMWLEGYSYWLYVKDALVLMSTKTQDKRLSTFTWNMDYNFARCGYRRGSVLYPPPFGDVRDEPIVAEFQNINEPFECSTGIVLRVNNVYKIKGNPIGLNTHIQKDNSTVLIENGYPKNFKFYTGYKNKYKSDEEELEDILHEKRIKSLDIYNKLSYTK